MNAIFIFVLLWLAAIVGWLVVSRMFRSVDRDRITTRIIDEKKQAKGTKSKQAGPAPLINPEDKTTGRLVMRLLRKFDLQTRLEVLIEQAGLKWKAARVVHACLAVFLASFFVVRAAGLPYLLLQLLAGAALAALPVIYTVRKRGQRIHKFEEQFPESLEFVARSMRAGHAFAVSLEMIHREFAEPLSGEFRRTFDEHNLGLPLDSALLKLAKRVPILDVHFFVSAVMLQKRTGGNLAEILDKLAYVIRERFKLRGKIRAISAHGRMTGIALTCIPMAVALLMFYVNPGYVTFFVDDEIGNYMAGAALGLQMIGYLIMRKIVSIEV